MVKALLVGALISIVGVPFILKLFRTKKEAEEEEKDCSEEKCKDCKCKKE
jgi:hypothetical protein